MKIAAISDIHGNIAALDAVLADIAYRGVDQVVNLGDIVSGPLFPSETASRLMSLALPTIAGNHERQVLTLDREEMGLSDRYAAACLSTAQTAWISSLPKTLGLTPDVLLVHGTPSSDTGYFLETIDGAGLRAATDEEIAERAVGIEAKVILCGHTHLPGVRRLDDGRLIVNAGSVGLQAYEDDRPYPHFIETGSPHARYTIVEKRQGSWMGELVTVEYDWELAAQHAAARDRPDWALALRTGRV